MLPRITPTCRTQAASNEDIIMARTFNWNSMPKTQRPTKLTPTKPAYYFGYQGEVLDMDDRHRRTQSIAIRKAATTIKPQA